MELSPTLAAEQPVPDSRGLNLYAADRDLAALLDLYLPADLVAHLRPHFTRLGALAGGKLDELAGIADHNPPVLHYRDRTGADRQWLEKHPAYRALEEVAFGEYGLAAMSHRGGVLGWPTPLPPAAKYALTYLFVQAEFGLCCPVSMTDALTRTLRKFADPALLARYLPGLTATDLDQLTQGAMFITEQAAGSDVGQAATIARPDGDAWRLYGDKWFCSNADASLALVLARPEGAPGGTKGLGLFLLPRLLPDGTANNFRLIRLKDKLGTRSMASGEILFDGALAYLIGGPGRGFVQMADMINMSRLSNGVRAAGLMRRAMTEALHVARHRRAFGRRLIEMPLMRRQLLKMLLPTEQARSMFLHTAACLQRADDGEESGRRLMRILTPLIKFRACRDARKVTGDAMEVRGGTGYIEEWADPRLLRDSHLGSIWEGTSNVVALDVLRAVRREGAGAALRGHLLEILREHYDALPADLVATLSTLTDRAVDLAEQVAGQAEEHLARQVASALYHVASAVILAGEGALLGGVAGARRLHLARAVVEYRLSPRDPLRPADAVAETALAAALLDGETP